MKKLATITFSAALALTSTTVFADKKTEAAIDYRQSVFTAVRWNFGTMGDMMKGKKDFDAAEFSSRADNVAALANSCRTSSSGWTGCIFFTVGPRA